MSCRTTRSIIFVALTVSAGIAAGVGTAYWRLQRAPWDASITTNAVKAPEPATRPVPGGPKAAVDSVEYDFGVMQGNEQRTHDFTIRNVGAAPLELATGHTSCRCTVSTIEKPRLKPGESSKITIKWTPRQASGGFHQSATVTTNDPERRDVTFTISGELHLVVECQPPEVVFSQMSLGEAGTAEVRVICNNPEPKLKITGHSFMDEKTARYFAVSSKPLPEKDRQGDASLNNTQLVSVTVKPGLPQGPFQQTILLRTSIESAPEFELPIRGNITSRITIAGAGWDDDHNMVNFDTVSSGRGAQRRLLLVVHGQGAPKVKFQVATVDAPQLRVQVGEPITSGATMAITPLVVEVPKGASACNHLGSDEADGSHVGHILLRTTHPDVPTLRVRVRFAVEG
jgi:hypothetical protein